MRENPSLTQLQCIAYKLEPIARANGYHIGITGSALYGPWPAEDGDLVVYKHKGPPKCTPIILMERFGLTAPRAGGDYDDQLIDIFKTCISGLTIDFIFI